VVLSGLGIKDLDLKTTGEFDFIIISSLLKSIIHIEAKNGNNKKNREHAGKQLNRGQKFFWNNCSFPASENWNYTKMMCFGQSVEQDICEQCKPFVLSANFFEKNKTQPVSKQISDQFKTFWMSRIVQKGKKIFFLISKKMSKYLVVFLVVSAFTISCHKEK
jgi:hypothetical protein